MKRFLFSLALCSLLLAPCYALAQSIVIDLGTGPVTMNPTAGQVTSIQRLTDRENVQRKAQTPPVAALTREEYIRNVLVSAVKDYVQQAREYNAKDACDNYAAASAAVKNQVDAALKGSPCR